MLDIVKQNFLGAVVRKKSQIEQYAQFFVVPKIENKPRLET